MKAIVKFSKEKGDARLVDIEEPTPGPGQVKIAVKAASICSSDVLIHKTNLASDRIKAPVVIGHEGAGIVVEVGEGVTNVSVGDRVVAETTFESCMNCRYCLTAEFNLCKQRKGLGSAANGFFAEYTIVLSRSVHKIPDNISFEAASLTEPLACATHAVFEKASVKPGDVVVVFGPGPIGLLTMQVAKVAGCIVILCGTPRSQPRLELGKQLGADFIINNADNIRELVNRITDGQGAEAVFECSGSIEAIQIGFDILRPGGQFIMEGVIHQPSLALDYNTLLYVKELNITGVHSTKPSSWLHALRLLQLDLVDTQALISHILPLEDWRKGFEMVESREALKVVLKP